MTVASAFLFLEIIQQILLCPSARRVNLLRSWLKHYVTSRKVAGFFPDRFIEILRSFDPAIDSASSRNEYQMYLRGVSA
jgi:hypothetical protein